MRYIFIVLFLVSFGSVSMGGIGDIIFCEMDETSGLDEFGLINPQGQTSGLNMIQKHNQSILI